MSWEAWECADRIYQTSPGMSSRQSSQQPIQAAADAVGLDLKAWSGRGEVRVSCSRLRGRAPPQPLAVKMCQLKCNIYPVLIAVNLLQRLNR